MASGVFTKVAKPTPKAALDGRVPRKAKGRLRTVVRIVKHSTRLSDADNLPYSGGSYKILLDCLRYCGLIENDDPETIDLKISQKRVKTLEECGTKIEIVWTD